MKKNILKMMAESNANTAKNEGDPPTLSPLSRTRRSSPVINNVGKALSNLSESSIVALDPVKIDISPYHDRFESDHEVTEEIENLANSMKSEGQKIPVLVRPHPNDENRYQLAYGHRRLAAIKLLAASSDTPADIKIRAYIRPLTDKELLVEQSLENGVRENLTWIEQALWAAQLRETGFSSVSIEPILGLSKTPISLMLKVAYAIPHDIILAIGRAKGVGRPKWMALAEKCIEDGEETAARIRSILNNTAFKTADASKKIDMAIKIAQGSSRENKETNLRELSRNGRILSRITTSRTGTIISIPSNEPDFARWLSTRLDDLADEYFSITTGQMDDELN